MNALKCVTPAATCMIHSEANLSTNRKTLMIEVIRTGKHSVLPAATKQSNTCVHCSKGVVTHKAQTEIVVTREQTLQTKIVPFNMCHFCILYTNTLKTLTRSSLSSNVFLPVTEKTANLTQTKAKV